MTLPVMPSTHRWFRGGPGLSKVGRNALFADDSTRVWVWDEETGDPVVDILDEHAQQVTMPTLDDGWLLGAGLPLAVRVASFSLGKGGKRYPLEPATALAASQDAAASAAASQASAASSASAAASSAALVGAPAGSAVDAATTTYRAAGSGDERAALNSFLATPAPLGVRKVIGSMSVSDSISVPAGMYLDLSAATITQTGSSKATLLPAAGATIVGGTIVGKGSDYVAGTTGTPSAVGCRVLADDVTLSGTRFTGHAGAGVLVSAAARFRARGVTVKGVGSPTIPANDSSQFGIYINTGCSRIQLSQVEVSDVSIGIIASYDTTHLSIDGARVHDIPGQHGLYIQNGTGLRLNGIDVWACNLNGVKLQINASATTDMVGVSLANITADSCGDTGLSINNVDTALTRKWVAVTITGVSVTNCNRGLYLGSIRGGSVSSLSVYNVTAEGVTFVDCQRVTLAGAVLDTCGRSGVRFTGVTNGSNDQIMVTDLRTHNPGNANVAGNLSGVYVNQCANLTIDGWKATSSNGFTDYSLFFASATASEQQGLVLRNADLQGGLSQEIRLMTGPVAVREFDNVRLAVNQVLNYPAAMVTRVGSAGASTVYQSNAVPSGGTYKQGDICWNSAPTAGGVPGWMCTAAPSTWKAMAALSA